MSELTKLLEAEGSPLSLEAAKALKSQYEKTLNAENLNEAFRSMLGENALKVLAIWESKKVTRTYHSWEDGAHLLTGEQRAQAILDAYEGIKEAELLGEQA